MRLLITGATGALGKALVDRLVHDQMVERLCVLSRDEHKIRALADQYPEPNPLRWFVGDVRDRERLRIACHGVDAVIHAAALKRIDAVINNSIEVDKTNIQGTVNILHAAMDAGVRKVLFISSDKACMPTNAYGCSKMMAECHTIGFNSYSIPRGMACAAVRYGNVFGSTGSIYHIWKAALAEGKPLPLTDYRMTRFHITLTQAVEFCLSSLMRLTGGEIFVPNLPAFRLTDLATAMGGHAMPVGLRPGGEKLAEIMLSAEEPSRTLWQDDRFLIQPTHHSWSASRYAGQPVVSDPHLSSDWPDRWMTVAQLKTVLEETP
jgi:UDP-N-acetylglucosamine 4,6-dehydratase/5-epimerase